MAEQRLGTFVYMAAKAAMKRNGLTDAEADSLLALPQVQQAVIDYQAGKPLPPALKAMTPASAARIRSLASATGSSFATVATSQVFNPSASIPMGGVNAAGRIAGSLPARPSVSAPGVAMAQAGISPRSGTAAMPSLSSGYESLAFTPSGSGLYRQPYKLTANDLSPMALSVIYREADPKMLARGDFSSLDAVIDTALNRVGGTGFRGSTETLYDVLTAPGKQFEAYFNIANNKPGWNIISPEQQAAVRERLEQKASGTLPDITNGAVQYRAKSYVEGKGAGKTFARLAAAENFPNIGNNIFGPMEGTTLGPYAANNAGGINWGDVGAAPAIDRGLPTLSSTLDLALPISGETLRPPAMASYGISPRSGPEQVAASSIAPTPATPRGFSPSPITPIKGLSPQSIGGIGISPADFAPTPIQPIGATVVRPQAFTPNATVSALGPNATAISRPLPTRPPAMAAAGLSPHAGTSVQPIQMPTVNMTETPARPVSPFETLTAANPQLQTLRDIGPTSTLNSISPGQPLTPLSPSATLQALPPNIPITPLAAQALMASLPPALTASGRPTQIGSLPASPLGASVLKDVVPNSGAGIQQLKPGQAPSAFVQTPQAPQAPAVMAGLDSTSLAARLGMPASTAQFFGATPGGTPTYKGRSSADLNRALGLEPTPSMIAQETARIYTGLPAAMFHELAAAQERTHGNRYTLLGTLAANRPRLASQGGGGSGQSYRTAVQRASGGIANRFLQDRYG